MMLTERRWFNGPEGLCVVGCGTGDHGECSDGACVCDRPECIAYRAEWYE